MAKIPCPWTQKGPNSIIKHNCFRLSKAGTESEMTEIFTGDILRLERETVTVVSAQSKT